ncbi:MAG: GIDE domain-containing protein [Halobacteriales archaeon]
MTDVEGAFWGLFLLLAGLGVFYGSFRALKQRNLIRNTATAKARSVPMGTVELEGKARSDKPLKSPFGGDNCVVCEYDVEEYRMTDDGMEWQTVESGTEALPFRVDDGTGEVRVEPDGAEFSLERDTRIEVDGSEEPPERIRKFLEDEGVQADGFSDIIGIDGSVNDRRYTERLAPVGDTVYVFGVAESEDGEAVIREVDDAPTFLISDTTEEQTARRKTWEWRGMFVLGVLLSAGGLWLFLSSIGIA